MTDRELRRMNRSELLELLIMQMEENERLHLELEKVQSELHDRRIQISTAGSIAEAALQLNGIFRAADEAAKQYLENVRLLTEEQNGEHDTKKQ